MQELWREGLSRQPRGELEWETEWERGDPPRAKGESPTAGKVGVGAGWGSGNPG